MAAAGALFIAAMEQSTEKGPGNHDAPAARSARAHAETVAPVVTTSSTSSTRRPASEPKIRCAKW